MRCRRKKHRKTQTIQSKTQKTTYVLKESLSDLRESFKRWNADWCLDKGRVCTFLLSFLSLLRVEICFIWQVVSGSQVSSCLARARKAVEIVKEALHNTGNVLRTWVQHFDRKFVSWLRFVDHSTPWPYRINWKTRCFTCLLSHVYTFVFFHAWSQLVGWFWRVSWWVITRMTLELANCKCLHIVTRYLDPKSHT